MSKKYFCDHCEREVHKSKKVSITTNSENTGFNILKGNTNEVFFIHRKNFFRLDYCSMNCMVKDITNSRYEAVKVK